MSSVEDPPAKIATDILVDHLSEILTATIERDLNRPENVDGTWIPYLVDVDGQGSAQLHTAEEGADYYFSQIDYRRGPTDRTRASRMIATIFAGKRTELAYWTEAAPQKEIDIPQGSGTFVVGCAETAKTRELQVDAEFTPQVVLPPGHFYTFVGDSEHQPLIVSGFYSPPVDFSELEIIVPTDVLVVDTPDGLFNVPEAFRKA